MQTVVNFQQLLLDQCWHFSLHQVELDFHLLKHLRYVYSSYVLDRWAEVHILEICLIKVFTDKLSLFRSNGHSSRLR